MKADLTFSQTSQLTILTTKYGGDPFDDVPLITVYLVYSLYVIFLTLWPLFMAGVQLPQG